jgi:hypothetical protein
MKPAPLIASLLKGLSKTLFVVGALSFLVGGGLIATYTKLDRMSAEVGGIAMTGVCVIFGRLAGMLSDRLSYKDEKLSITNTD